MVKKIRSLDFLPLLAIISWLLIALVFLAFFLADLGLDYEQIQLPCTGEGCNFNAVSQAEIAVLEDWGLNGQFFSLIVNGSTLLAVSLFWLLGGALFRRQGATRVGWFYSLALIVIPITLISDADNVAVNYPFARIPAFLLSLTGTLVLLIFLYTFPNGRFYPRWSLIPLTTTILTFMVFVLQENGVLVLPTYAAQLDVFVLTGLLLLGVGIQIFRYRRVSTKLERQQTKWGLLGIFSLVLAFPGWFILFGREIEFPAGEARLLATMLGWPVILTMINALPLTIAMAILRYRLWDIDLIIRRTLQYSLLSGLLALVYFGAVTVLQSIFTAITGQQSAASLVLSTLGIAALFNPLRKRIQNFIDRRFYRQKYDAEKALAAFAEAARSETGLEALTSRLTGTVQETLQPTELRLWFRKIQKQERDL